MPQPGPRALDLMPPAFAEGLDDWSRGDGSPDSPTYEAAEDARLARGDPDFDTCLELRKTAPVARLRYMGELPVMRGAYLEVAARVKALRGPIPLVQVAAWPGGMGGVGVPGLPQAGAPVRPCAYDAVTEIVAVIGPAPAPGVDLVWDGRVLYAHVGLDLVGPEGGVLRIESVRVRDVTLRFAPGGRVLPGFEAAAAEPS
jgi:hypothetical protein